MKTEESIERAQLIRAYEANCRIDCPSEDDKRLRLALSIKLGLAFKLGHLRKRYAFDDANQTPAFPKPAPAGKANCPHN